MKMLGSMMEDILSEISQEIMNVEKAGGLPPGFRFHPTDEELITFYLASKVFNGSFCGVQIAEVDLNRCEPWELPDVAKMGEKEWYFFSLRDRKYPTGLRTNRATGAGYWKATGKDREVHSASSGALLGMKKTLVFYRGRAPRGEKTKWVMHEYRLEGEFSCRHTGKEEWVICRIFHKNIDKRSSFFHEAQGYINTGPHHNIQVDNYTNLHDMKFIANPNPPFIFSNQDLLIPGKFKAAPALKQHLVRDNQGNMSTFPHQFHHNNRQLLLPDIASSDGLLNQDNSNISSNNNQVVQNGNNNFLMYETGISGSGVDGIINGGNPTLDRPVIGCSPFPSAFDRAVLGTSWPILLDP